jgi:hypothetical protein
MIPLAPARILPLAKVNLAMALWHKHSLLVYPFKDDDSQRCTSKADAYRNLQADHDPIQFPTTALNPHLKSLASTDEALLRD